MRLQGGGGCKEGDLKSQDTGNREEVRLQKAGMMYFMARLQEAKSR